MLTVIDMLPSMRNGKRQRAMCRCQCECGNVIDIQCDYIKSGDTKSCGCIKSIGEQQVLAYLIDHNICYKQQYSFPDLKTDKNYCCYFDFAILDNDKNLSFLIEYQGIQHYKEISTSWNFGKHAREVTDPLKRKYCQEKNIPLFEIKYTDDIQAELDKIFACQSCAKPVSTGRCNDYLIRE